MKCKFCNGGMEIKEFTYPYNRQAILCNNHQPIKVLFKPSKLGNRWIVSNGSYRLVYWGERTLLQKYYPDAQSSKDTYQLVAKFDFEPNFLPEDFNKKIKTLLTFL